MKFADCTTDKERVAYFRDMWKQQARFPGGISLEAKDSIGIAYLEHVIGADSKIID